MKKTLLLILVIAAIGMTATLLFAVYSRPRPTSSTGVKLVFLGLSNVPPLGSYAVFTVTNAGPERVAFNADALEYRTSLGWVTNSLRNTTRRDWLYWHHDPVGGLHFGKWDAFGGELESGMSATFGTPVTVTGSVWRLDFYCVEQATGGQGLRDRAGDLVQRSFSVVTNGPAREQTTFTGRRYHLMSPEISP